MRREVCVGVADVKLRAHDAVLAPVEGGALCQTKDGVLSHRVCGRVWSRRVSRDGAVLKSAQANAGQLTLMMRPPCGSWSFIMRTAAEVHWCQLIQGVSTARRYTHKHSSHQVNINHLAELVHVNVLDRLASRDVQAGILMSATLMLMSKQLMALSSGWSPRPELVRATHVEENVQATILLLDGVEDAVDIRLLGNVAGEDLSLRALTTHLGRLLELILPASNECEDEGLGV